MKLHLPSGLREALLACLAALSSRYNLSRTVATGTALLGAFSLLRSGDLRADESLPLDDQPLVSEEESLPPGVNEVAGNATDIGILPIAVTSSATEDVDAGHSALTGGNVTYSGTIYTWNVEGQLNFYGTGGATSFTPWVASDGAMTDGEATSASSIWTNFIHGRKSVADNTTYDSLRLVGATGETALTTSGMTSQGDSAFCIGGLIVETSESGGSYSISLRHNDTRSHALYWGAGTNEQGNKFRALILSDTAFTDIRSEADPTHDNESTYGFHIISDAEVRIAKGKTLAVESILQIDAEKTVTLSAVGTENAVATFRVSSIDNSAAASASSLVVGDGVNMEVTEGVTGPLNLSLGANAEFSVGSGSLALTSLTLTGDAASLAMTLAAGTTLTLEAFTDGNHTLTIHLDGLTEELLGDTGYALFGDGGWNAEWSGKILVDGEIGGKRVQLNDQGLVVLSDDGFIISDQSQLDAALKDTNNNQAGMTWYIDMESAGHVNPGTINADVILLQTLTINNGSSNDTVTFGGAFSAEKGTNFEYAWAAGKGGVTYAFTGNLENFHGDMVVTESAHEVTFSFAGTTGDGAITNESDGGAGSLKVALNGTNVNATIHANDLSVTGNVTLNKNVTITGVTTVSEGATLTLGEGAQTHLGSLAGGSSLTSLTLGAGSEFALDSGSLTLGTLVLAGDNASLAITLADGTQLSIGTLTDNSHTLTIYLDGLTEELLGETGYALFGDGGWNAEWSGKILVDGEIGGKRVQLNDQGLVVLSDGDPGTVDATITSTAEYKAAAGDATKNAAGKTWNVNVDDTVENYSFWFQGSPGNAENWSSVTEANLHLLRTLTVGSNGSSDKTQTFNGAITGEAGADLVFQWGGHTNTWQFNGDLSGFSGNILSKAGTINVVFGNEAKTNTGAIKQDGGTLNLTVTGQSLSNGEISVNNFTLNGTVSVSGQTQVTVAGTMTLGGETALALETGNQLTLNGKLSLEETATLTVSEGGTLTLGDDVTLDLLTNEVLDDSWSFTWGVQGVDDATLERLLAGATINGNPLGEGMSLELSEDGSEILLVGGSSQPGGGTTEEFGPKVEWTNPVDMTGDTVLPGTGGNLNYKIADNAKVTGGAAGMNLRLQKTVTGSTYGNGCHLAGDGGDAALTLDNLYLTADPNEVTGDGEQQLYFDIKGANYLSGVQDVWIKNVGLIIQANMNLTTTNFHLGSNDHEKSGGWFNEAKYRKFTLCLQSDLTTGGTLDVVESARIVFDQPHTLTVGSLTGKGDLSLSVVGGNAATLAITGNSESYGGHIIFAQSGNRDTTVKLGDGVTLSTAGIGTSGENLGGKFERQGETGAATVKVTGTNEAAAENVVFGEGVTLELAEGSGQNFGAGSHITALKGAGALWVQGGDGTAATVTVDTLAEYTGEIHLFGDGTGKQAVLQLGGAGNAGGGTLSKVVLRQGGGDLQLGQGAWTLNALEARDASTSQLHIGATGAAGGTTLAFGDVALGEHVELTLGGGIDYSGTIVVDATGGATGERLFKAEDAGLLDGLTLRVLLDATDFNAEWAGLQLFGGGLDAATRDALLGIVEVEGGTMGGLELEITEEGVLHFVGASRPAGDIVWQAGADGVWQTGGKTQWTIGEEETYLTRFQEGDSVTFGAAEGAKTVQVEGAVAPTNVTIDGAAYTFNAAEGGEADSIEVRGGMRLSGGASAAFNLPVTFSNADGASITGTGKVTFGGAVTGNGQAFRVGDGSGALEVQISVAGDCGFGETVVNANSKLVLVGGVEGTGTVRLNGGSIGMSGVSGASADGAILELSEVQVTGGGSAIGIEEGSDTGTIHIGTLGGGSDVAIRGTDDKKRRVAVDAITDYTGHIAGTLDFGRDGTITMGAGKSGRLDRATVDGTSLKKVGDGSFTIGTLRLNGEMHMTVQGGTGKLAVEAFEFGNGATFVYELADGKVPTAGNLLEFNIGAITKALDALGEGTTLELRVDGIADEVLSNDGLCLGITGNHEDVGDLRKYFHLSTSGDFSLSWGTINGVDPEHLYLTREWVAPGATEYDRNWGLVTPNENTHGPGEQKMGEYAAAYRGGVLGELLGKDAEAQSFTGAVLSLSGHGTTEGVTVAGNTFYENGGRLTGIRLTGGAEDSAATHLSVVGGSVYGEGIKPESESRRSFIVLRPEAAGSNHYHLLVGGSSCVSTEPGEGVFIGFRGNTHIQVEGGVVDYIVGGNHVTNTFFGFSGDTYISIFDNNHSRSESAGDAADGAETVKTEVRGGIVGGSVITSSDQENIHHDFEGHTHIFLYTLLGNGGETPHISDGAAEGGTPFTAVVGGNAWIDVPENLAENRLVPVFRGGADIYVNLLRATPEQAGDKEGDGEDAAGSFDKAIVGGNYAVAKPGVTGVLRSSRFEGNSRVEIYAGEGHKFTAGINGASRRDSGGSGTTEYIGDTHVDIHGGQYTEAVAGGMWFNATGEREGERDLAVHTGTYTGNTNVVIEDGRLWRVVGGNVSLEGGTGSKETFTGVSNVTIKGGTFAAREQDTLNATEIPAVVGGSFYRNTTGTATHTGGEGALTNVTITGGTFSYVHIVGGDCVNMSGVDSGDIKLEGSTHLVIGGKGSTGGPEIVGLLAGGSHLSDSGANGNIIVGKEGTEYATEVEIHGGKITAEGMDGNPHAHGNVAVVAGNVLLDSSTENGGGHVSEILGGTHLVMDGGEVNGFVVGGSYSSDSRGGTNELAITGNSTMEFTGGTVNGNIVGGHFSENTSAPDKLTLGNVGVTVAGGTVNGYIFGGSFRRALGTVTDADGTEVHPHQGELTVTLRSGTVAGGVYAAGNNYNTGEGAELHVHTDKTVVQVTGDVELSVGADERSTHVILSGGYLRNSTGEGNRDYSTVGYDKGTESWSAGPAAVLEFLDSGEDNTFENLKGLGETLRLQDFDAADVKGMDIDLSGTQMHVMHKVVRINDKGGYDNFTKLGSGDLTLAGLKSWNAQASADGKIEAYAGMITIDDGHLKLVGGETQSLLGGLAFNMANLKATGLNGEAYLQGQEGMFNFTGAGITDDKKVKLDFLNAPEGGLTAGVYRLVSGVNWEGIDIARLEEYFASNLAFVAPDEQVEEQQTCLELQMRGDSLLLRVYKYSAKDWVWQGDGKEEAEWGDSGENFTVGEEGGLQGQRDVYFYDGVVSTTVKVTAEVMPRDIYVEGGKYTLTDAGGRLNVGGILHVGAKDGSGTEGEVEADFELALGGNTIPQAVLHAGGRLTLSHATAIQGTTSIQFQGGILKYGESGGQLALDTDLAGQVAKDGTGPIRVHVGDSAQEQAGGTGEAPFSVTWAGATDKAGIAQAVNNGLITGGRGKFVLEWDAAGEGDSPRFAGTLEAQEGTLELRVGGTATIGNAEVAAAAEGAEQPQPRLFAEKGATLILAATGEGSGLTVQRAFSGTGTIVIGESASLNTTYVLDVDNGGFEGTVKTAGDGTKSTVQVNTISALGGANSTLALAGRAIVLADGAVGAETPATIAVKTITVEGTNYVGGYDTTPSDANKAITLTATEGITGDGVLANAQGGYAHTLVGGLKGFTGTIAAGAAVDTEVAPAAETAGTASTWTLSGEVAPDEEGGTSHTVAAGMAGTGKIIVDYTLSGATKAKPGKVLLTGSIGESVSLENGMADTKVVLVGEGKTSTGELVFNGNEIWLGDEDGTEGSWAGTKLAQGEQGGGGTFRLKSGTLKNALTDLGGVKLVVDTAVKAQPDGGAENKTWVRVGGTAGSMFDDININEHGRLREVGGNLTVGSGEGETGLSMVFTKENIGESAGNADDYLIGMNGGDLVVNQVAGGADGQNVFDMVLDFDNGAIAQLLIEHRDAGKKSWLHVVTGGTIQFGEGQQEKLDELLRGGQYSKLLAGLGFTVSVQGGDLVLTGSSEDVYLVLDPKHDPEHQGDLNTVTDPGVISGKKAVLVDEGMTLTIDDTDNGSRGNKSFRLRNLVGLDGSTLRVGSDEGYDDITVIFDNNSLLPADKEQAVDPWLGDATDPDIYSRLEGLDTVFEGRIEGHGKSVNFVKDGAGTLTVGNGDGVGGAEIDGGLTLKRGDLVLRGSENRLGKLAFGYTETAASGETRGVVLEGTQLTVGSIDTTVSTDAVSDKIDITKLGELIYEGSDTGATQNLSICSTDKSGTLSVGSREAALRLGGGSRVRDVEVRLSSGGTLALEGNAVLNARAVVLGGGRLDLSKSVAVHTAESLTGSGEVVGVGSTGVRPQLTLTGKPGEGKSFSGTLSGNGRLNVVKDAELRLDNVTTKDGVWGIGIQGGGSFTLDTTKQHGDAGATFGDVLFAKGANVTMLVDYSADGGSTMHTNTFTIEDGVNLTLVSESSTPYTGADPRVRLGYAASGGNAPTDVNVKLQGECFLHYEVSGGIEYDNGAYYVGVKEAVGNKLAEKLRSSEKNVRAGTDLFWSASEKGSPARVHALANPDSSDLLRVLDAVTLMMATNDTNGLTHAMAAGAGASISVLGPALAEDMHRQLNSTRNRATAPTEDLPTDGYDAFPYRHVWITGEGGYRELDADGFAPGYTLNSWGGSLGVDVNISRRNSAGLALTAMYGDLETKSADNATGDIDTVYLSGYLRHASGAWSHTIALGVGVADLSLDRTVSYGTGSYYRTSGSTDGMVFGALYEVGYTKFVNKRGTFAVQPVANVEVRHALIDGYTETGSDAGLQVDDIEQTVVTFGAGVRTQGLVGGRVFNNSALLEARALVKADVGDRSGTSRHAIIRDTTHAEVESAEVGAVGAELGVGLSIPLGTGAGSIIVDGSAEFRSGWTSANATLGYRISF